MLGRIWGREQRSKVACGRLEIKSHMVNWETKKSMYVLEKRNWKYPVDQLVQLPHVSGWLQIHISIPNLYRKLNTHGHHLCLSSDSIFPHPLPSPDHPNVKEWTCKHSYHHALKSPLLPSTAFKQSLVSLVGIQGLSQSDSHLLSNSFLTNSHPTPHAPQSSQMELLTVSKHAPP